MVFAHAHCLALVGLETHQRYRAIGYWGLVTPYHLVAVGHAAYGAVANGNQKMFAGNGWQTMTR